MPYPPQVVLILVAGACLYFGGKAIGHEVKKASHGVCHVVTLGKKCQAKKQ